MFIGGRAPELPPKKHAENSRVVLTPASAAHPLRSEIFVVLTSHLRRTKKYKMSEPVSEKKYRHNLRIEKGKIQA
jgi:hypothetical protein